MWARLEDELLDHPKITVAGRELGKNGRIVALGFYTLALLWSNRHLSDGVVPVVVIETFRSYVVNPVAVADALVTAGLFELCDSGYRIHDFRDYNLSAASIKRKRKDDRVRKALARANGQS